MIWESYRFWAAVAIFSLLGLAIMGVLFAITTPSVYWQNFYKVLALIFVIIFLFSGTLAVVSTP